MVKSQCSSLTSIKRSRSGTRLKLSELKRFSTSLAKLTQTTKITAPSTKEIAVIFLLIALIFDNPKPKNVDIDHGLSFKNTVYVTVWSSKKAEDAYVKLRHSRALLLQKSNARNASLRKQYPDPTEFSVLSKILKKWGAATQAQQDRLQELLDDRDAIRQSIENDPELKLLKAGIDELGRKMTELHDAYATITKK